MVRPSCVDKLLDDLSFLGPWTFGDIHDELQCFQIVIQGMLKVRIFCRLQPEYKLQSGEWRETQRSLAWIAHSIDVLFHWLVDYQGGKPPTPLNHWFLCCFLWCFPKGHFLASQVAGSSSKGQSSAKQTHGSSKECGTYSPVSRSWKSENWLLQSPFLFPYVPPNCPKSRHHGRSSWWWIWIIYIIYIYIIILYNNY